MDVGPKDARRGTKDLQLVVRHGKYHAACSRIARLQAFLKPTVALLRGAVSETIRVDVASSFFLDIIVALLRHQIQCLAYFVVADGTKARLLKMGPAARIVVRQ